MGGKATRGRPIGARMSDDASARPTPIVRRAATDARKVRLARGLRRRRTRAEVFAWRLLRDRKMLGLKFRRQQVLCGYEVDFYCGALRLVVEIDGAVHDDAERAERDARRTTILARRGVRVVRLENARLNRETLREAILPFTCPLSLQGEGDGG